MSIFYTNDIGKFFDRRLLEHLKQEENDKVLAILRNEDPRNLDSSLGTTLLHFSAKYGNTTITQYLIDLGMKVDVQNRFGETPLMFASMFEQLSTVKLLLKANADPLLPDIDGHCCLGKVFSYRPFISKNIVSALINKVTVDSLDKKRDYIKSKHFHYYCPLYNFISARNADITRILLENGSPVDARESSIQETALHMAARQLHLENVKTLLKFNANVNAKRGDGQTPLAVLPVYKNQSDDLLPIVKILIDAGAALIDYESKKFMARSLLVYGNREIVRAVLDSQIDLQFQDWIGDTALHVIACNQQPEVIEELQHFSFAVTLRSRLGDTLLHVAAYVATENTIKYLLNNGADINAQNNFGKTPLKGMMDTLFYFKDSSEIFFDYLRCIEVLLERGARPQLRSPAIETDNFPLLEEKWVLLAKPVLAQLALVETSGQEIEVQMKNQIEACPSYKTLFDLEKQQLDEMKVIRLDKSVTLFDFLTASDKEISLYAKNQRIISNMTNIIKEYISDLYCHRRLQKCFVKFTGLVETRKKLTVVIGELFIRLYQISVHSVAEKIVNYLDDQQLYAILKILE